MEPKSANIKRPVILINSVASSDSLNLSLNTLNAEPEMEEFDEILFPSLQESRQKQKKDLNCYDPDQSPSNFPPNPLDQLNEDVLLHHLSNLKCEILKVNSELQKTYETLNSKKQQNLELQNSIKRIESSLGKNSQEAIVDQSKTSCSCYNSCLIS